MRNAGTSALAVCVVAVLGAGEAAWAQPNEPTGEQSYILNCAVCHGMDARGNGPLASALKAAPSDLTRLAARHDGRFPSAKIADVIRSGGAVLGHGTAEMPAWGVYFGVRGKPEIARARIQGLVRYIESIQER